MGSKAGQTEYPATSDEMTAALNAALEAGDLNSIMGVMGRWPAPTGCGGWPGRRAWAKRAVQVHAGRGQPEFQHRAPGAAVPGVPTPGPSHADPTDD